MKQACKLPSFILFVMVLVLPAFSCKKDCTSKLTYYEVGMNGTYKDWRDTSFVVATRDPEFIKQLNAQLKLPIEERQLVIGKLEAGSGGYNKNATHEFKWHFKEDDWQLADMTIEIYDGRPYSDVDSDIDYWLHTMTRFAPWSSYIKRKIK
jgi:hypothetical protein